jgi:hypothetical protein
MKRNFIAIAVLALAASSPLFAQSQIAFRAAASGTWTASTTWEKNDNGVWLKPIAESYPGDITDQNVNVMIGNGTAVTIGRDEVVHINSLSVSDGGLLVLGTLIVGPAENDPQAAPSAVTPVTPAADQTPNSFPQLMQNVPNPLAPQFGFETTIRFYIDREYSSMKLTIYDDLAHVVQQLDNETNPTVGWHEITVRLDKIQSGTYPLVLELPNTILRKMITVVR